MESCVSPSIVQIEICSIGDQRSHRVQLAIQRSLVQSSMPIAVTGIEVTPTFEQLNACVYDTFCVIRGIYHSQRVYKRYVRSRKLEITAFAGMHRKC